MCFTVCGRLHKQSSYENLKTVYGKNKWGWRWWSNVAFLSKWFCFYCVSHCSPCPCRLCFFVCVSDIHHTSCFRFATSSLSVSLFALLCLFSLLVITCPAVTSFPCLNVSHLSAISQSTCKLAHFWWAAIFKSCHFFFSIKGCCLIWIV